MMTQQDPQNPGSSKERETPGHQQFVPVSQGHQMPYPAQFQSPTPPYQQYNQRGFCPIRYSPDHIRYPQERLAGPQEDQQFQEQHFIRPPSTMIHVAPAVVDTNHLLEFDPYCPSGIQRQEPTKTAIVMGPTVDQEKAMERERLQKEIQERDNMVFEAWLERHDSTNSPVNAEARMDKAAMSEQCDDKQNLIAFADDVLMNISPDISTPQKENILEVRGFNAAQTTKDALELFFENESRSGGGEIKKITIDTVNAMALITFEDPTVMLRVLANASLTLNGEQLYVCEHQPPVSPEEPSDTNDNQPVKTIKVTNFKATTSDEVIELFFENSKRSGGDPHIESCVIDRENMVAYITYEDSEVAKRVASKSELILDDSTLQVTLENKNYACHSAVHEHIPPCMIKVSGLKSSTTKDTVENFFINKKRTGGGKIEHLQYNIETGVAIICFTQPEVAQEVVERGLLILDGSELSVRLYEPVKECQEAEEAPQPCTRTIKVTGYDSTVTRDTLEHFFENKRKSGGGEVESVEMNDAYAFALVTFAEEEVVQRVLFKADLKIDSCKLEINALSPDVGTMARSLNDPAQAGPEGSSCIKVSGLNEKTTYDALENYFENRRISGGGHITSLKYDKLKREAIITFADDEAVTRIFQNDVLKLDGSYLDISRVSPPKPKFSLPVDEYKLLVSNISDKCTKEGLENFLEARLSCRVIDIRYGSDPSSAMVTFEKCQDFSKIQQNCSQKKLEGSKLLPKQVYVTNAIQVHDLPHNCSIDMLENYFENAKKSDGGNVAYVELFEDDHAAVVYFEDQKVVPKVLQKRVHLINKQPRQIIKVAEYYEELGICHPNHDSTTPHIRIPSCHVFNDVDDSVLQYVASSGQHKSILDAEIQQNYAEIDWGSCNGQSIKVVCRLQQDTPGVRDIVKDWQARVDNCVEPFFSGYKCIKFGVLQQLWNKVIAEMNTKIDMSQIGDLNLETDEIGCEIRITGVTALVETTERQIKGFITIIETEMERAAQEVTETVANLKEAHIRFILAVQYPSRTEERFKGMKISTSLEKCEIVYTGLPGDISNAKIIMYEVLNDLKEKIIKKSSYMCKLLMATEVQQHILSVFKENNVIAHYEPLGDTEVNLIALDENTLKEAAVILKQEIVESSIPIPAESKATFQGADWHEVVANQCNQYPNLIITTDSSVSKVTVTCTKNVMGNVLEIIRDFNDQNTVFKKEIRIEKSVVRLLITHQEKDLSKVQADLRSQSVTLTHAINPQFIGFTVAGTKTGLQAAENKLRMLCNAVQTTIHRVIKPGMPAFFSQVLGQTVLSSIETQCRCIIEIMGKNADVDKGECFMVDNGTFTSDVVSQVLLPNDRKILVFKGDMTKHKVDVIVNAANTMLLHSGGLAAAISSAGGSLIQEECNEYIAKNGELLEGQVMTSQPGRIKTCKRILHAVGPMWQGGYNNEEKALFEAVCRTLEVTEKETFTSVAIPALSSGIFGYPLHKSTKTITESIKYYFEENTTSNIAEVHLIDIGQATIDSFKQSLVATFGTENVQDNSASSAPYSEINVTSRESPTPFQATVAYEGNFTSTGHNQLKTKNNGIVVIMKKGVLSKERADVLVNTTSMDLKLKNGAVSADLLKTAGPQLQQECSQTAPNGVKLGEVVITAGYNLKCKKVFHGACKKWDGSGGEAEKMLRKFVNTCLEEAEKQGFDDIAFPAIGTGSLNVPRVVVAKSMYDEVHKFDLKRSTTSLKKITFVVYDKDTQTISAFEDEILRLSSSTGGAIPKRHAESQYGEMSDEDVQGKKTDHGRFGNFSAESKVGTMRIGNITFQVQRGDITFEKTDAIVNSTNKRLDLTTGAVAKAIVHRGGSQIQDECKRYGKITDGIAVTNAGTLKCKKIIHVVVQDNNWSKITMQCLKTADSCSTRLKSISLPLFGTGGVGKTASEMAAIMLDTIGKFSVRAQNINLIRVVIFQEDMFREFQKVMRKKSGQTTSDRFFRKGNSFTSDEDCSEEPKGYKKQTKMKLYALNNEALENAVKKIDACCNEESKDIVMEGRAAAMIEHLTLEQKRDIKQLESCHDVKVEIDERLRHIRIMGRAEDTYLVKGKIEKIFAALKERGDKQQQAMVLAGLVQWMYLQHTDSAGAETWKRFSKEANLDIETAFKLKKSNIIFNEDAAKYKIEFDSMKETRLNSSKTTSVKRIELAKSASSYELPKTWNKMSNGSQVDLVTLLTAQPEYKKVEADFKRTCPTQIIKISRVQNPRLWENYCVHKTHMEKANPKGTINEQPVLYHGTSANTISNINLQGFNRSFCGKNGVALGQGVYFARDASYSVGYAHPGTNGHRYMYQARVLTGQCTPGNSSMIAPPPINPANPAILYDSTVNSVANPSAYVAYNDNQAYPEYLIELQ